MTGQLESGSKRRCAIAAGSMLVTGLCGSGAALAQTDNVWSEPSGGSWIVGSNWSLGQPANLLHQAVFFEDFPYTITLDTALAITQEFEIRGEDQVTLDLTGGVLDLQGNGMPSTRTLLVGETAPLAQAALIVRSGELRTDSAEVGVGMDFNSKLAISAGGTVKVRPGAVMRIGNTRGEGLLEIGVNGFLDAFGAELWIGKLGRAEIIAADGVISVSDIRLDGELGVVFGDVLCTEVIGDPASVATFTGSSASLNATVADFGTLTVQLGADVFMVSGSASSGLVQQAGSFLSCITTFDVGSFELVSGATTSIGHTDVATTLSINDSDSRWLSGSMTLDDGATLSLTDSGELKVNDRLELTRTAMATTDDARIDNDLSGVGPGLRAGHLSIGAGGQLLFENSYEQWPSAELRLSLDSDASEYVLGGVGFNTATLAGALALDVAPMASLGLGLVMPILTTDALTGAFDLVIAESLGDHRFLEVMYPLPSLRGGPSTVTVNVQVLPALPAYAFESFGDSIPSGTPVAMVAADYDDNGLDDLAVLVNTGPASPGTVRVYFNLGVDLMGDWLGFSMPEIVATGIDPRDIDSIDLEMDGDIDLVATNFGSDSISLYFNTMTLRGLGTNFAPGMPFNSGDGPTNIESGDVDSNPGEDVIVVNELDGTTVVFPNDGTGDFGDGDPLNGSSDPEDVDSGDVDNDKDTDVGTTGKDNLLRGGLIGKVRVFENDNGTLIGPDEYVVGGDPGPIVMGDLNGDSAVEIAVINQADDTISILVNDGSGAFTVQSPIPVNAGADCLLMMDAEGDGDLDLFMIADDGMSGRSVQYLRNDTTGFSSLTLTTPNMIATATDPLLIEEGNADGDGLDDLFTIQEPLPPLLSRKGGAVEAVASVDSGLGATQRGALQQELVGALINESFPLLPGDLNFDGVVGAGDLANLIGRWGPCPPKEDYCVGDLDGDGVVGASDLAILLGFWT